MPSSADEPPGVAIGDTVLTTDGRWIGMVLLIHGDDIVVEGGVRARRYFVMTQAEIARRQSGMLVTALTLAEVKARERR